MTDTSTTSATTSTDDFDLNELDLSGSSGAEAAREAFKKSQTGFDRLDWLSIDGSPEAVRAGSNFVILRFLSDHVASEGVRAWLTVEQHSMVPTKPKPADFDGVWPAKVSAVCRNDKLFAKKYGDCYIDTMEPEPGKRSRRPSARTWAIAVLREEVVGDGSEALGGEAFKGKVVGIRDKMKEIAETDKDGKATGETRMVKHYVKVNQGWKNFFAPISGIAGRFHTVLDRDIYISREGTGQNDTTFSPVSLDPIHFPAGHKFAGRVFDLRDADQREEFYPDMPDLLRIVAEQASNEYFNRFFMPDDRLYGKGEGGPKAATPAGGPANAPATPPTESAPPTADRLAALKARVSGAAVPAEANGAPADTPQEAPAQTPQEAPGEQPVAATAPAAGLAL